MKKLIGFTALALMVSACDSGGAASPSALVLTSIPVGLSPAPIPSVTPSVSPSPSPSPSPSASILAWSGFSGNGDMAHPYEVTTATDVTHIGDFPAAYFELTGSIDMTGVTFTPIPTFSGVIQGHLHQLNHLTISEHGDAALVLSLHGIINGLYFQDLTVSSAVGYAAGYSIDVYGTVSNSQILSAVITAPLCGNGNGSGTGNPIYTNFISGAVVTADQATVTFNGNSFYATY